MDAKIFGMRVAALVLLGCGGGDDSVGGRPDAAAHVIDAGAPDAEYWPDCHHVCTTPDDCVIPGSVTHDADNWHCVTGACVYLGCLSDAECAPDVCSPFKNGPPICENACHSPADCDFGAGPEFSADNYVCDMGRCRWIGCVDQPECVQQFGAGYECRTVLGFPSCQLPCGAGCPGNLACHYGICAFECTPSECERVHPENPGTYVCR